MALKADSIGPPGGFMKRIIKCIYNMINDGAIKNSLTSILIAGGVVFSITSLLYGASPDIPVGPDEVFIQGTNQNELKIMSYNVLNLFDAEKDVFSDDWLWLPKNYPGKQNYCNNIQNNDEREYCQKFDWTPEKLNWKLEQIRKVVHFQGSLPDMLAVMEVENDKVLQYLAAKLGYQYYIITSSADKRGIDVGLLFNARPDLTYVGWSPVHVRFRSNRPGRDIMRADFTWRGKPLSIYVNHWPSQRNPVDERISSAQALARDVDQLIKNMGPTWSAVAVGDFNTIEHDDPNPFNDVIHHPSWANYLFDAEAYARQSTQNPALPFIPPGSYYYIKDDTWNRLDRVVTTQNLIDGKDIEFAQESYRLLFPQFMSFMVKRYDRGPGFMFNNLNPVNIVNFNNPGSESFRWLRVPNRYNFDTPDESKRGFSDHLPVVFKLRQLQQ